MNKEIEELEFLKSQLDAICKYSYDGINITDGNGLYLKVNYASERITGIKKEEIIGSYAHDLVKRGIVDRSIVLTVIQTKKRTSINQTIKGETIKEVMVTGTPIFDDNGEIRYIVVNLRDMTDLIALENECNKAQILSKQYYSQLIKETGYKKKIIAESHEMKQLLEVAYRIAQVDSTVLLEGESGTGKEVFSTYIHEVSPRAEGPFISINCAGIPDNLLEAELFGYEEGAFTGAKKGGKVGLIELAEGGTLFLDEINSMPIGLQGKLLRVIETHEVVRVGSTKINKVDFRLIAATTEDLQALVKRGIFRQDLFYRLRVVPLTLLPLRKRREDIIPLALHYLKHFNIKYKLNKELSSDILKRFENYYWQGNVRELKNVVERLVVISVNDLITSKDLPEEFISDEDSNENFKIAIRNIVPLNELLDDAETKLINLAMKQCNSTREAAKALKISQTSVVRKFNEVKKKLNSEPIKVQTNQE